MWIDVVSSNVSSVAYHDGDLYVKFKVGTVYRYMDVPKEKFDRLLVAESAGKFLHAEVFRVYQYSQVKPDQEMPAGMTF